MTTRLSRRATAAGPLAGAIALTVLSAAFSSAVSAPAAIIPTAAAAPAHEIVGYYPGWKSAVFPADAAHIDATQLTVLLFAFLDTCWNGHHGNPNPAAGTTNKYTADNNFSNCADFTQPGVAPIVKYL